MPSRKVFFIVDEKVEELSHHFYTTKEDLFRGVDEYVAFFNTKRLHQLLSYKPRIRSKNYIKPGNCELLSLMADLKKKTSRPEVHGGIVRAKLEFPL